MIDLSNAPDISNWRYLVIADLHLHHQPEWRLRWCADFVYSVLALQTTKRTLALNLVLLGDVFEVRNRVEARPANLFLELVCKWHSGDVLWVTGQHDSYKPGIATFASVEAANQCVFVMDDHREYRHGEWSIIPFIRDLEVYRKVLTGAPSKRLMTHVPVREAIPGSPDQYISANEFDRLETVVSGDIHHPNVYGRVRYVGAPSQRDWRDHGVPGTVGVICDDGKLHLLRTECIKHVKLNGPSDVKRFFRVSVQNSIGWNRYIVRASNVSPSDIVELKQCKVVERVEVERTPVVKTGAADYSQPLAQSSLEERVRKYAKDSGVGEEIINTGLDILTRVRQ